MSELENLQTFSEFQNAFSKMNPMEVGQAFMEGTANIHSYNYNINFYSALIDRLMEFGYKDESLSENEREVCIQLSDRIIDVVRARFGSKPDLIEKFEAAITNAKNYYNLFKV